MIRRIARRLLRRGKTADSLINVTASNTPAAYERLYGTDEILVQYLEPDRLAFYDEVAADCAPLTPVRVADVGCGTGHLLAAVAAAAPSVHTLTGIDRSAAAIRRARELLPDATLIVDAVPSNEIGELAPFDLVLCCEVLEHVSNPEEIRDFLFALCARGGHVVVTVPDGAWDTWEGHANFWSETELVEFLGPERVVDVKRLGDPAVTLLARVRPLSSDARP